jgi:putative heme-binding domain-containing protein
LLDLYSGDNRGRIYRLVGPNSKPQKVERLGELSTPELVARLASLNGWTRETAHRLLWERRDVAAVDPVRQLLKSSPEPLGRMHALRTLAGLRALTAEDVLVGLNDAHPRVREHAIQLSEVFSDTPAVLDIWAKLTSDTDQRVLFQLAFSLGESKQARASEILGTLLKRADLVAEVRAAALTSVGANMDAVLLSLATGADNSTMLGELAQMIGAQPDVAKVNRVLKDVCGSKLNTATQRAVLRGVGDGLQRRGSSLRRWLSDRATDADARSLTAAFLATQSVLASDAKAAANERAAAALLIASADDAATEELLAKLLSPTESQTLQLAAVRGLSRMSSGNIAKTLLSAWKGYSPQVRADVVEALLVTVPRAETLLIAVEAGEVRSAEISPDRKQLLLNHSNAAVKERAKKVLGGDINNDRAAVVKTYSSALELAPSVERGQATFGKKCLQCHKLGQQGFAVGPDIVSVQNKAPADLLIAMLDPSREAQPAFMSYSVILKDGRVFNGLIAAESANSLTIRKAEGKEDVIDRTSIEELVSSGKSLMPEGLEKELQPQDVADVIAFIKSLAPKK